ncbi:MAG: hypothetical protein ACM3KI_11105 [Bacillota bacterium]
MKKFIFIALFGLLAMFSQAQVAGGVTSFAGKTVTDTQTDYLAIATPVAIQANYVVGIEISATATSSSTVTASIQVSDNNTTWYNYGSSVTLVNAGVVSNYAWEINSSAFKYYRVRLISSGSGSAVCAGKLILKYE